MIPRDIINNLIIKGQFSTIPMENPIVNAEDPRIIKSCYMARSTIIDAEVDRSKLKTYLGIMFFLIGLISSLLEIFREVLIITKQTPSSIYFIKLFLTFPVTFIIMILIQYALNKYDLSKIYKFVIICYIIFFFAFALLLLPNEDALQKGKVWVNDLTCDDKLSNRGMKFIIPILYIYSEWIYTFLYVASEVWGTFMVSYLFFTYANSLSSKSEMEDILPYLSTITAISMILSALLYVSFDYVKSLISYKTAMIVTSISFICIGCLTCLIYFLKVKCEKHFKSNIPEEYITKKTNKESESLWKLLESRLLRNMALISIIYSFNAGIIEASFKNSLTDGSKIREIPVDRYSSVFINSGLIIISLVILVINFGLYKKMKSVGLLFSSLISPIVSLVSIVLVSCLSFYNYPTRTQKGLFLNNYLMNKPKIINFENWVVTISGCLIKVTKYVNFDMAKECISMRISAAYRGKYKSVYDGVCIKLGRSFSSLYGAFFTIFGVTDIRQISPITLSVCIFTSYLWIRSVFYLNKKYQESLAYNQEIDVDIPKNEIK